MILWGRQSFEGETDPDTLANIWTIKLESGEGLERFLDEVSTWEAMEL